MENNFYKPQAAEILAIRSETDLDWTYRVKWRGQMPEPGQFFQVSVPRVGEAPFSVSGWGDDWIEMTIRQVGLVTNAIFNLNVGDSLHLRGPYGHPFPVEEYAGHHIIIAAGGTGLAPVRSLIQRLLATRGLKEGPSEVVILTGFKSPAEILFWQDLQQWAEQTSVTTTVDKADENWTGPEGVITTLIPDLTIPNLADTRIIVVGPAVMMKFTLATFLQRGIAPEHLWLSHERRMSCGVGKCGHCKIMDSYVCIDGPVYRHTEAQWLMD